MVRAAVGETAAERPAGRKRVTGQARAGEIDDVEMELDSLVVGDDGRGGLRDVRSRGAAAALQDQLLDGLVAGIHIGRAVAARGAQGHAQRPVLARIEDVDGPAACALVAGQLGVVVQVDAGSKAALPGLVAIAVVPLDGQPGNLGPAPRAATAGTAPARGPVAHAVVIGQVMVVQTHIVHIGSRLAFNAKRRASILIVGVSHHGRIAAGTALAVLARQGLDVGALADEGRPEAVGAIRGRRRAEGPTAAIIVFDIESASVADCRLQEHRRPHRCRHEPIRPEHVCLPISF